MNNPQTTMDTHPESLAMSEWPLFEPFRFCIWLKECKLDIPIV